MDYRVLWCAPLQVVYNCTTVCIVVVCSAVCIVVVGVRCTLTYFDLLLSLSPWNPNHKSYAAEAQPEPVGNSQPCSTGTHFPVPCPKCYGQAQFGRGPSSAQTRNMWAIVDEVHIPNVTGDFVLRWRWDTEQVHNMYRPIHIY